MTWLDYPITWFIALHAALIAVLIIGFWMEATKDSGPPSVDGKSGPEQSTTNPTRGD